MLFEVHKVPKLSIAGDELWTVLAYKPVGNVAIGGFGFPAHELVGGDHHWVREIFAQRAKRLYEDKPDFHGATEDTLRIAYWEQYGERMFELPVTEDT